MGGVEGGGWGQRRVFLKVIHASREAKEQKGIEREGGERERDAKRQRETGRERKGSIYIYIYI